jgi:hypothetical protein
MAWRHATGVVLSSSAALVLFASFAGASSCLPSASAVRQEHPGSWPSWTLRAPGYEGTKCWYPTTRPDQNETAGQLSPPKTAHVVRPSDPNTPDGSSLSAPATTNGFGWSRETLVPQDLAIPSPEGSLFSERFDAVFDESFFSHSSLLRRLADLMAPAP